MAATRRTTTKCSCGAKRSHKTQIKKYPVGARVVAITEIDNSPDGVLPFGATGKVTYHCDDGRASIQFDADGSCHTFHSPELYIAAEWTGTN